MGFLKRVLSGGDRAPDWASFMTGEEYRAFEAAVVADLTARGFSVRLTGDGGIEAHGQDPGPEIYGLFNLAQVCHMADRPEWPRVIREHFDGIARANLELETPPDLEAARAMLRVRIHRVADTDPGLLDGLVKVNLAPDLVAALALDFPTTVRTCSRDDVQRWGLPVDALFEIGAENLAAELPSYERSTIELGDGQSLETMLGDSFFVASQAYRFAEIVGDVRNGALLVLPNRHQVVWHVIETAVATMGAVQPLLNGAATAYAEGPGSLTPDLYWWHRGAFTLLPSSVDRKGIQFFPPADFLALLKSLA